MKVGKPISKISNRMFWTWNIDGRGALCYKAVVSPHTNKAQAIADALGRFRPEPTIRRRLVTPVAVGLCKILIEQLNSLTTIDKHRFDEARCTGRALLTFSNHIGLFDDPFLVATFSGIRWDQVRWCAVDALNFFSHPLTARFFGAGKAVPIVRGAGIDQMGMHFLQEKLQAGDWVHIFPEGGRSRDPKNLRLPFKGGLAHLVQQTRPLVLGFHHHGMEQVMPIGRRVPRIGKRLELRFAHAEDSNLGLADQPAEDITRWAQDTLLELEAQSR